MDIKRIIDESSIIMTEGAVVERLRREFSVELNPHIVHSALIYDAVGKSTLKRIYNQYIKTVQEFNLPILIFTPTRRANPERLSIAGYDGKNVNGDCFQLLSEIRDDYGEYAKKIFIGGLIGCKGDAYKANEALSVEDAYIFHKHQISTFCNAGVDFLCGTTLPAFSEALGIAKAMSDSEKPYILSFVIRSNATLLDGTSLHQAISKIDSEVNQKPMCYMVNCVHPSVLKSALNSENCSALVMKRLVGIQANTSSKSPEELDGSAELVSEDMCNLIDTMVNLHYENGLKILGGCCGTNDKHIQQLVSRLNH
jgi:homocysteine S-methyltransferase